MSSFGRAAVRFPNRLQSAAYTFLAVSGTRFIRRGHYRTNAQLLYGQYKVDSKHGKVSVALERKTYNDEWSQISSGWKRAKIKDEEDRNYDSRAGCASQRGGVDQGDYAGHGTEKRFSVS